MMNKDKIIEEVKNAVEYWQEALKRIDGYTAPEECDRRNREYQFWVAILYYLTKEN